MSYARVRARVFAAVRMRYRYPWRPAVAAVGLAGFGWVVAAFGGTELGRRLVAVAGVVFAAVTGWWWVRQVARPCTTKVLIRRRAELDQRAGGVATMLDIAEVASPKALRLQARVLRPAATAGMSWWRRWRMDPGQLGVLVAALGWGPWRWGQQVWTSIEDATLRIGGPRMGKTISLAPHGLHASGALLTTSTRLDLAQAVHATRLRHGPVHFFNPAGLGNVPSTVRWRVLDGCENYETADRRAADLIPPSTGDRDLWDTQARRILALLLHAAALSGRSMREVVKWSAAADEQGLKQVIDALLEAGPAAADRVVAVRDFWTLNARTKSSITSTMAIPLAWMYDDRARELGDAAPDDPRLVNIRELIQRGHTLHLIGHEQRGTISPLIGAFVAEIAEAARALAGDQPSGRLDPPLTMLLDEAAIVVPVPLHEWTADMGGRGVTMHISVQSLAQMRSRWGRENADALLGNIACFLVFGGSAIHDDLAAISALTGRHRLRVLGVGHNGHPRHGRNPQARAKGPVDFRRRLFRRRHDAGTEPLRGEFEWRPVLSEADIRALEPGQVLLLRRHLPAVVGWAPRLTDRRRPETVPLPRTDTEALEQLEALYTAPPARARTLTAAGRAVAGRVVAGVQAVLSGVQVVLSRRPRTGGTRPVPVVRTPAGPEHPGPDADNRFGDNRFGDNPDGGRP